MSFILLTSAKSKSATTGDTKPVVVSVLETTTENNKLVIAENATTTYAFSYADKRINEEAPMKQHPSHLILHNEKGQEKYLRKA